MAGFINAILLVYSSVSILIGALERIIHPHFEIHSQHLLPVSIMGLLVNIVGLFAFGHQHESHHGGHFHNGKRCCAGHDNSQHNFIKDGMFMHVAADTLGSVAVIVSSLIIKHTGWLHADTLCSTVLALLILASVKSLLLDTFHVLLNGTPKDFQPKMSAIRKDLESIDSVKIVELKIWEQSSREVFALVRIASTSSVPDDKLKTKVVKILERHKIQSKFSFVDIEF